MTEVKQQAVLEVKKNERVYTLILPADAPLGEAFDVITEMRGYVIDRCNEVKKIDQEETQVKSDV